MKLSDFEYYASTRNNGKIHIADSFKALKNDIFDIIKELREKYPNNEVLNNRTDESLRWEWLAHNLLYKLRLFRNRTKDLGLEYPQSKWLQFWYKVIGKIAEKILD